MTNIHQMAQGLLSALEDATGYNFVLRRNGVTYLDAPFKVRQTPSKGMLTDGETITISDQEKVMYVPVTAYVSDADAESPLVPQQPLVGDILIDTDHNNRKWRVLPQMNGPAWSFHGSDEKHFRVLAKMD